MASVFSPFKPLTYKVFNFFGESFTDPFSFQSRAFHNPTLGFFQRTGERTLSDNSLDAYTFSSPKHFDMVYQIHCTIAYVLVNF